MSLLARLKTFPRGRAVRLVWESAPGWTLLNLAMVIVQGLLPLAALYIMKRIIDAVTAGVSAADKEAAWQTIVTWVVLAALTALAIALARSLSEFSSQSQSQIVTDYVTDVLHARSIAVDLSYYENPAYYDTLHRAQQEAPYRPTRILNGLVQAGQNGLSLLGIAGLLISFNWMVGVILIVIALPGAMVRLWYARRLYSFEEKQAEKERKAWYYHWMLVEAEFARELRLFGLGELFRGRFRDLRKQLREGRLALTRRRALSDFLVQSLASVAVFAALGFMSYQTIQGEISLGSLVIYYLGFQSGLGYVQNMLHSLAGLYEDHLFLTNFYQFLDLQPQLQAPQNPRTVPSPFREAVTFENVSFSYSNAPQTALDKINLTLHPGEVIALVGENGAGKTTLIKLLCRLYDPAEGRVRVDGIDLREMNPADWQKQISVVFQDYIHYYMKAWENIWLGDASQPPDMERIRDAARLAGADAVISRLPDGYETGLGNWFDDGKELSTGQWQKIAVARAFYRNANIVVLDEPTSSLDPLAEAELFRHFRQLIAGRSAILISHRFSTVQMADRIYVLDCGRIVESGTHAELMKQDGQYARLYRAQAQFYQPTNGSSA